MHYHLAAMHPFPDGNGRTARATEALMMQRVGLKDILFIPMSNYYHDNKDTYLSTLARVRGRGHDLTPFVKFALRGVETQASRLAIALGHTVKKELFRNFVGELFVRLERTRKRVIVRRQLTLLNYVLRQDHATDLQMILASVDRLYVTLKDPFGAMVRDLNRLMALGAIQLEYQREDAVPSILVGVNLDWPSTLTDTEFFERLKQLPKSTTYGSLMYSS